jgi:hypothetical protein
MAVKQPLVLYSGRMKELQSGDTLPLSFAAQAAKTFFAGPTSGGAATPTFRQVEADDIIEAVGDAMNMTLADTATIDWTYDDIEGTIAAEVPDNAVTLPKLATMATASFLGRNTAGTGNVEVLSVSTVRTMLSINNVENTALSTWAGSTNITTVGTITTGTWSGTTIGILKGGTNATSFGTTNGVVYYDGTRLVNHSRMTFNGSVLQFAPSGSTPVEINWGAAFGGRALTLYDGGATERWGWALQASEMQFFGPSSGTNHISFNKGGDLQASGTNEVFRFNLPNGNLGIGVTAWGTSAAKVIGIGNGTAPSTSPADMIQIFSVDASAGNATLGLRTEAAVATESVTSDRTLQVVINGTVYKLCLKA